MGKKLGEKIKEARKFAEMTQEQLASEVSGLTAAELKKIEAGEMEPTRAQLKAIAEAAGVSSRPLLELADREGGSDLTAEELRLVRLYRKASAAKKKSVMEILKQESGSELEDLLQNILGGLTGGSTSGSHSSNTAGEDALAQILENAMKAFTKK